TLGVDLTTQGAVGHDRDLREVRLRRDPGAWVDQVMHRMAPAALADPTGADRTVAERDQRPVAEPDMPAVAFRTVAAYAEVTPQVANRVLTELIREKIGQHALGDAAQIERCTGGQGRRARGLIEDEHVREWRQLHR